MKNSKSSLTQQLILTGLLGIVLTSVILLVGTKFNKRSGDFFDDGGVFFINYMLSLIYFFVVLGTNRPFFKFRQIDRRLYIISLILFSISCFSLNQSIVLFATFSNWVMVYLILFYLALIGFCFKEKLPNILQILVLFLMGAGLVLVIYFAAYLAPLYHIAILGLLFLGLSLHLLIPLLLSVSVILNFIKLKKTRIDKIAFTTGIIIPLLILSVFLMKWNGFKEVIHKANASVITRPDNKLPEWIILSQDIPSDSFSQKIVKGNLVFDTFENMWGGWSNTIFDEVKRHDPMVNIGLAIFGDINIDRNTRVKILKSQFDARHLTQRKLWSGKDLETTEVLSQTKVFVDYRMAYTEKIITIKNNSSWQNNQQEAAYTFYLPEGSVASSLSLWIDGKEQPSRLTTKEKADSAYVSIVGVERRDPALLHWQEGNTITVTVFPCTPKENRKFKIGVTTPLKLVDNQLVLSNVYFEGPASNKILETNKISFESSHKLYKLEIPEGFKEELNHTYSYTGKYKPYWEIRCEKTPLADKIFAFNNNFYSVTELNRQTKKVDIQNIYLDINKSWTKDEYYQVLNYANKFPVYAHRDTFIKITDENRDQVFNLLSKRNFSLFPFGRIAQLPSSLVISKSTRLSPNLSDLEGSDFINELTSDLAKSNHRINYFQIGAVMSPYIKTLKEFQILNFNAGTLKQLASTLKTQTLAIDNSDNNQVDLHLSHMSINKIAEGTNNGAPDHLLRLFSYNQIMKQLGKNYFNKDGYFLDSLNAIANEAYIVTPVSSLVVLETLNDYDRFGIDENNNSLKNATMKSSGAVPEPSEWVLIILFSALIILLYLKKQKIILN